MSTDPPAAPTPRPSTRPGSGLRGFLAGLTYPFRGLAFLATNRASWRYAIIPGLVNFGVLLVAFVVSMFLVDDLAAWLRPEVLDAAVAAPSAQGGFFVNLLGSAREVAGVAGRGLGTVVLYLLSFLLAAAGAIVGALVLAAALAGPFQERLSEVVEQLATGRALESEKLTPKSLARDGVRAVSTALQRVTLFSVLYIPLFAVSIIPGVGVVGAAGTLVYSSFFGALNFMDPTLERRKLPLRSKLTYARARLAPWLGYGTALLAVLLVPFVGLLLTPAFVAGGTLLWLDTPDPAREDGLSA